MSVKERLKYLQEAADFPSFTKFAEAAGLKAGAAQKHLDRDRVPYEAAAQYAKAARHTGVSVDWILKGTGLPPRAADRPAADHKIDTSAGTDAVQLDAPSGRRLNIWRLIRREGGSAGALMNVADRSDWEPLPLPLQGKPHLHALRIWDQDNAPWLNYDDTVIFDQADDGPLSGWCVFARPSTENGMVFHVLVRMMLAPSATSWRVRHGEKPVDLTMADWPHAWKIVNIRPK